MRTHTARIGTTWLLAMAVLCVFLPTSANAQVLNLAWDPSATDQDYRVHVGTTAGSNNVLDQWVPNSQTTFAFPATPGVRYYFAVSFVDDAGVDGPWSATVVGGIPTFAQPANQTGVVGTAIAPLSMSAVDPDGGALTFSATGLPAGLTINGSTGRITGTPSTAGTSNVTVSVRDLSTLLERSFTWTISASSVAVVSAVSASPNSGSGGSQSFALVYTNSLGASNLASAQATFGASPGATASGCAVSYNPSAGLVSLLNDAGTSWQSASLGSGLLENSQCAIALASTSAPVSGTQLTLNLAVSFSLGYTGTKSIYLNAASTSGPTSGWVNRGSWTVPTATLALTSNVASPKPAGTAITFSATVNGSASGYQFKWWLFNGTTWSIGQEWGTATFAWTPTEANASHRVGVWARVAGSTSNSSALNSSMPYSITQATTAPSTPTTPLVLTGLTASVASPQATGTAITFTATASGGSAPYQYKWWLFDGASWSVTQNWSTTATVTWTPTQARTNYRIGVWARSTGSTADNADVSLAIPYVVTSAGAPPAPTPTTPLVLTGLKPNVASPQATGTAITFIATASGGSAPYQYKWWLFDGTTWVVSQNWSTSATFAWTPTQARTSYRIGVWARNAGETADTSAVNLSVPYVVTGAGAPAGGGPLRITGLSSNVSDPHAGTPVTFTATATGATGPYQYKWWIFDGRNWSIVQTWGSGTFTWTPPAANSYRVGVWVRDSTTTADTSQVNLSIPYTVAP